MTESNRMKENVTVWNRPENVTLGDTNTPRIEQTYSGGPENVTVPGYSKAPDEGGKRLDSRLRGNDKRRGVWICENPRRRGDMEKDMTLAATYSSNGLPH
jgi:hypothetical protein